jgi:hypothetical protein
MKPIFARVAASAVALAAAAGLPEPIHAQPEAAEVADTIALLVTNVERAPLRSGSGLTWYAVSELPRGTVLRLDGEIDGFFRVAYPSGTPSVVKVAEGELDREAEEVRLTRRSPLWAFNRTEPYADQCYKRVFSDNPLPPGTRLSFLGPMQDRKGELAGFKVVTPGGALGFVAPGDVRPATDAETRAWLDARDAPGAEAPAEPPPAATAEARGRVEPTMDRAEPAEAGRPGEPEAASPEPAGDEPEMEMVAVEDRPAPADAAVDPVAGGDVLELLDDTFERVMATPLGEARFEELILAYTTYRDTVATGEDAVLVREYVDARLEALEIRQRLQAQLGRLETIESGAVEADEGYRAYLRGVAEARGYDVVGRLTPSMIYDGRRAPLMYRVLSITPGSQRTIAYVMPGEGYDLRSLAGSIVGVRGRSETSELGRAPVLAPDEIERLNVADP